MRLHRNVRELRQGSQLAHAGPQDSKTARPEVGGSAQRLSTDLAALGNKLLFSSHFCLPQGVFMSARVWHKVSCKPWHLGLSKVLSEAVWKLLARARFPVSLNRGLLGRGLRGLSPEVLPVLAQDNLLCPLPLLLKAALEAT